MSLLVVGEALVDVVVAPDGSVTERPGGSPANVAVGLHRLGHDVMLATCLGDDPHGRLLEEHLTGVHLVSTAVPQTSTAVARLDDQGRADYDFSFAWRTPDVELGAEWLHVGSLAALADDGVLRLVERFDGRVSYDPNLRPQLLTEERRTRALALAARADVVKLSDDDAALLLPGLSAVDAARALLTAGAKAVVVTLGQAGAMAVVAGTAEALRVPAADGAPVVDTIGAGDAFTAGLVDALHDRDLGASAVRQAIEHASRVARRACERPGADPPWREEVA